MAGDWIKMRGNLWDDPRVSRLVDLTDSSEAAIVGALYWLWATADQHSADGLMVGLTTKSIDRKTGVQGFGDALVSVGWIADHPEGVRIIRFNEHNGKSAKRRCSESVRKMSARDADKEQQEGAPRVERREEKSKPISVVERVGNDSDDEPGKSASTRKGEVCGLLRQAGMADAAPHYLTDDAWAQILSKRTNEEIVSVAVAKMAARPGQRTGLKYIAPVLLQDPEPIAANARASPRNGRQSRIDNYAAEAAAARGEHENEHSTGGTERDITGESIRVA